MLKRVLVPISHGTEELEAVAIIDLCRRAGLQVNIGKVSPLHCENHLPDPLLCVMSRGVILQAERQIESYEHEDFDCSSQNLPDDNPSDIV